MRIVKSVYEKESRLNVVEEGTEAEKDKELVPKANMRGRSRYFKNRQMSTQTRRDG